MDNNINVHSDIDILKKVMVHRPDSGIEWVTPTNKDFLLYDDIVYLPKMQAEHDQLVEIMEAFVGKGNVVDIVNLLGDILIKIELRKEILECVVQLEKLNHSQLAVLEQLDAHELAHALVAGLSTEEEVVLQPCPNLIFTRDIGVVIEGYVLTCFAAKFPRKRENIITWYVLHYHQNFAYFIENHAFVDLALNGSDLVTKLNAGEISFEGGDIMMLDRKHLIIGCSERTNMSGILCLRDFCFSKGILEKLTVVDIPKEAYCMHLDTIFTQIDKIDFVIFDKILMDSTQFRIIQYREGTQEETNFGTLSELIIDTFGAVNFIHCGNGESPYDEREQWTMACNTVAMKPGVVISYFRNPKTMESFKKAGYSILEAEHLLEGIRSKKLNVHSLSKTIITFFAGELCRAGGGPHCLTFPLARI